MSLWMQTEVLRSNDRARHCKCSTVMSSESRHDNFISAACIVTQKLAKTTKMLACVMCAGAGAGCRADGGSAGAGRRAGDRHQKVCQGGEAAWWLHRGLQGPGGCAFCFMMWALSTAEELALAHPAVYEHSSAIGHCGHAAPCSEHVICMLLITAYWASVTSCDVAMNTHVNVRLLLAILKQHNHWAAQA